MTIPSKTKSRFEQILSEIYARRPGKNDKQVCIDFLKQDEIRTSLSVKIVVALTFMCSIIKILHLKFVHFVMYKRQYCQKLNLILVH